MCIRDRLSIIKQNGVSVNGQIRIYNKLISDLKSKSVLPVSYTHLYTSRVFHTKLEEAGMRQSMSRVGKCIDNGPMEGFWGILKRERYYGKRFTSREELVSTIEDYMDYYNTARVQRNLGVLTPFEKHQLAAAA